MRNELMGTMDRAQGVERLDRLASTGKLKRFVARAA